MRRVHDVGGLPAGPIDRREPPTAEWEKRVGVLLGFVMPAGAGVITIDAFRRAMEDLGAGYWSLNWYERATLALANLMLERGAVTVAELALKLAEQDAHAPSGPRP